MIIPLNWRKLNFKAISFEFYNPRKGFAFPLFFCWQVTCKKWLHNSNSPTNRARISFFKSTDSELYIIFFKQSVQKRCSFTVEILFIRSRISRLQCSIIDVNIAIVFFSLTRKPLNFEILVREWRRSNGFSFYLLFTTLDDFLCGAKFWNSFLSLIWHEREFADMTVYNLT